jgi:hypothetical protein
MINKNTEENQRERYREIGYYLLRASTVLTSI